MQPGEDIWGNEERDVRNRMKNCKTELKGGNEGRSAEDETLNAEQVENGGRKLVSQETEQHGVSSETQKTQLSADKCSSASTKLQKAVSPGVNDLSSPLTEKQSQQKEKVNEDTNSVTFRPQLSSQVYENITLLLLVSFTF